MDTLNHSFNCNVGYENDPTNTDACLGGGLLFLVSLMVMVLWAMFLDLICVSPNESPQHTHEPTTITTGPQLLVGFMGLKGAGKDTSVKVLAPHGFRKASFAGTLKDIVSAAFGWDRVMLEGTTERSRVVRKKVDGFWAQSLDMPDFTPIKALQLWGTDVVRRNFHSDFWILSLVKKVCDGVYGRRVAISDVRFPNEAKAIHDRGGIIIRLERGALPEWYTQIRDNYYDQLKDIAAEFPHANFDAITSELLQNSTLPEWFSIIMLAERTGKQVNMADMYITYSDMPHESEWRGIRCEDVRVCNNGTQAELRANIRAALCRSGFKV